MKTIQIAWLICLSLFASGIALNAQPTDHPPIPQIDRTDNASQNNPNSTSAKATNNTLNIDFAGKQYFKLVAVKVADINHKHTASEMAAFEKEAEGEFAKTAIAIDWKGGIWYARNKQEEGRDRTISFAVAGNKLSWTNCLKCQDGAYTIIEQTDNILIVQVAPQDEGQHFVYQYHFTK